MVPYVPLNPTTPEREAGCRTLHPVSVAIDAGAIPEATETAEPELLPPGTRLVSHGFFVIRIPEFSPVVPMANSSQFTFQRLTIPASLSRLVAVDS